MSQTQRDLLSLTALLLLLAGVMPSALAQHDHHHRNAAQATPPSTSTAWSSAATYVGQQNRQIKALSAQEQQDWLEGKGMGLAKAAELNGFPGPMHTLEHADAVSSASTK